MIADQLKEFGDKAGDDSYLGNAKVGEWVWWDGEFFCNTEAVGDWGCVSGGVGLFYTAIANGLALANENNEDD